MWKLGDDFARASDADSGGAGASTAGAFGYEDSIAPLEGVALQRCGDVPFMRLHGGLRAT